METEATPEVMASTQLAEGVTKYAIGQTYDNRDTNSIENCVLRSLTPLGVPLHSRIYLEPRSGERKLGDEIIPKGVIE